MPESKQQILDRAGRIAEALWCMRSPRTGEIIHFAEKVPDIAMHLARAGLDVHPELALIKRRAIPNRPGQFAGLIDWVPIDSPDPPENDATLPSFTGAIDLDALDDALPWHVKTKFEGKFA